MKVRLKKKLTLPEWKVILTYRHTHTQRRRGVSKKTIIKEQNTNSNENNSKIERKKKILF